MVKGAQHPFIGRLCTLSHCLRHGGRFHLSQSGSVWLAIGMNRQRDMSALLGSICPAGKRKKKIMSESTGSRSRLVTSEMFVFCSSLLVSLTFGVSCQRSRQFEIRWLNVKQPTSTRLWLGQDRTRSQVKLIMSVLNWLWLNQVSIQHSQSGLIDIVDSDSSSNGDQARSRPRSGSRARDVSCSAAHLSECSAR